MVVIFNVKPSGQDDKVLVPQDDAKSSPSDSEKTSPATVKDANPALPLALPDDRRSWWQRRVKQDDDAIATRQSVYDDPDVARHYQPRADWENINRFDPSERWTVGEERKVIRKMDICTMIWTCIMFMALELDRSNLGQALADNFLGDLGLDRNDYNLGNTIFRLTFLWIPMQLCLWSIVSATQFWRDGKGSFLACRALLALFQGGFIPDKILYLSYFYTASELSVRLAFFWGAYNMADIFSGFLAAGFLQLRGFHGLEGWRWLFLFEGLMTLVIGILAWFLMPAGPTQTKGILRGKDGWFSEREEVIMVNRVIRDDPSKGDMHNRQPVTPKLLWASMKDYDLWPIYAIGLVFLLPFHPPNLYFTLTLRDIGFSTLVTNLLTIPQTVISIFTLLAVTYLSEKWDDRALVGMGIKLVRLSFLIYLYVVDITQVSQWASIAVLTLMLGVPNTHPIQVAWNSRNSNTVRLRTVSAALYNMAVQADGIIASNIHRANDAPLYRDGNKNLIALACMTAALYVLARYYYIRRNSSRDKIWNNMTEDERKYYLETTKDEGSKRLDFRFSY